MQYLIVGDTPSIKKFVFGTDKLKEIRGASMILDDLNRLVTPQLAQAHLPQSELVYANGGTCQILFSSSQPEQDFQRFQDHLQKAYYLATAGQSTIQLACVPVVGSYAEAIAAAYRQLGTLRYRWNAVPSPFQFNLSKLCATSGGPAEHCIKYDGEDDEYLSQSSYLKREAFDRPEKLSPGYQDIWKQFGQELINSGYTQGHPVRPKDLSSISHKNLALVYADGNGFGKVIKSIPDAQTYQRFATQVDQAIREACFESLREVFKNKLSPNAAPSVLPADILMLGGDDLMVILPAEKSFRFIQEVGERFSQKTKAILTDYPKGFTVSFGVVYAKPKFPFRQMLALAEELLKNAKKKAPAQTSPPPSYIDFQLAHQAGALDLKSLRQAYDVKGQKQATMRPYTLNDFDKLAQQVQQLKERRIPRSRLNMLYDAVFQGGYQSELIALEVLGRSKSDDRQQLQKALEAFDCVARMPWRQREGVSPAIVSDTVLIDLIELLDMLEANV